MTKTLYQAVFGSTAGATQSEIDELSRAVGALPENIFSVVLMRYAHARSLEEIAVSMHCSIHLVDTWLKSGIAILQCFYGVYKPALIQKP